ncbi:hypothetical protein GE09DRAFT_144493 [Coniochaeta sp. 2T2.1]|nr:hypothetical protein GE09DRAFT_144493 [Coniochaeta sp. 2T2.1]
MAHFLPFTVTLLLLTDFQCPSVVEVVTHHDLFFSLPRDSHVTSQGCPSHTPPLPSRVLPRSHQARQHGIGVHQATPRSNFFLPCPWRLPPRSSHLFQTRLMSLDAKSDERILYV